MLLSLLIVIIFIYYFVRITSGETKSVTCLVGKTAVVTGGNTGIGFQVCLNLASRGCRVIIANRSGSDEARRIIIERTKNPNIVSKIVDLASFKSVRKFAKDILATEERLDILINNAGVGKKHDVTEDGLYTTMQINHYGGFLLTHLLISLLKKSAPSRIIFTSSLLAYFSNLTPNCMTENWAKHSEGLRLVWDTYANTKLLHIINADMFGEKLRGTGVTSNSVHPGWVRTDIFHKNMSQRDPIQTKLLLNFLKFGYIFSKNVWEGAQSTTHAAVAEELEGVSGAFIFDCCRFPKPRLAYDRKLVEEVWRISEECVKLREEEKL